MRPLEILTPIILTVYLLYPLTGKKRPPAVGLLPAFALVVLATHANVEGKRWQMIPLYAFTVATLLTSIPAFFRTAQAGTPPRRPYRVLLSLVLLALSRALPVLLPVPSIPNPGGPYQVGTRIYELTDTSRRELYSGRDGEAGGNPGHLPAEIHPAALISHPLNIKRKPGNLGLPGSVLSHLHEVLVARYPYQQ